MPSSMFHRGPGATRVRTLPLHAALPIFVAEQAEDEAADGAGREADAVDAEGGDEGHRGVRLVEEQLRSEEHTSELQSRENLVCRLLLEKKTSWLVFWRRTSSTSLMPASD